MYPAIVDHRLPWLGFAAAFAVLFILAFPVKASAGETSPADEIDMILQIMRVDRLDAGAAPLRLGGRLPAWCTCAPEGV